LPRRAGDDEVESVHICIAKVEQLENFSRSLGGRFVKLFGGSVLRQEDGGNDFCSPRPQTVPSRVGKTPNDFVLSEQSQEVRNLGGDILGCTVRIKAVCNVTVAEVAGQPAGRNGGE